MIGFFPTIYPDELVYSWFARYYLKSGYSAYRDALKDLYKDHLVKPSIEFINPLNTTAKEVVTKIISMDVLIQKHTMFPYYCRFMQKDRKNLAYEALVNTQTVERKFVGVAMDRTGRKMFLRYCPKCVLDDRSIYGECYWHREHQLKELKICTKHYVSLLDTDIPIAVRGAPRLHPLENIAVKSDTVEEFSSNKIALAKYVCDLFQQAVDFAVDADVGTFLNTRLFYTKYVSARGEQRNMQLLYSDYRNYYSDFKDDEIMQQWQLQKLFDGHRIRIYEVCQLAIFLGVSVKELTELRIPLKTQQEEFDSKIDDLHKKGMNYADISREIGVSYDTIKNSVYKTRRKQKAIPQSKRNTKLHKRIDYGQLDKDLLPLVKQTSIEIYGDNRERPKRVTIFAVERRLKLPSKQLYRLP